MIHYGIPEPELSPDFTLGDIHKIRTWNYERMKDAAREEYIEDMNRRAEPIFKEIEALHAKRQALLKTPVKPARKRCSTN